MPQTIRRGCQPNHSHRRIDNQQGIQKCAVHANGLVVDQVALVDDANVDVAYAAGLAVDRLNASKSDGFAQLLPAHPSRIDAHRRTRPMLAHLLGVLLNQFLYMGQHHNFSVRPILHSILTKCSNNMTLARSRRKHQAWVAFVVYHPLI